MNREKRVDLSKMNRLGVITVASDRLYRDDSRVIAKGSVSPTEAFFRRMQQCNYKMGEDCIISNMDDENLILAHLDNNAIFLLSENPILSPKEFVNSMANVQESAREMNNLIARSSNSGCSSFCLDNLNINFADVELATGMSSDVVEHYLLESPKNNKSSFYKGKDAKIGVKYSTEHGTISHAHSSQYGINLVGFLDEIVAVNPDIRLLISNTVCRERPINLRQIITDTVGIKHNKQQYKRGGELSSRDYEFLLSHPDFRNDEEFLKAVKKEMEHQKYIRTSNNEKYEVYPAFKYVVELLGKTKDVDEKYLLEWYDGDPDNGKLAITTALNNMIMVEKRQDDSNICAPRAIPEIKDYMEALTTRAHDLSKSVSKNQKEIEKKK